jgi:hypothetical protein
MADLSVAEAASALGLDESRVRQMLRSGALAGRHVGRAWVVPADAVAMLSQHRPAGGRPLSPQRAWGLLDLLDGGKAPWLDRYARSKVRAHLRRLAGGEPAAWGDALRARERRQPVRAHRAALARLRETDGVWPAGPASASLAGADLVAPGAVPEFYINAEAWPGLAGELRLAPAPGRPDAVVRVPRDVWPFGPGGPGRAVLAASLLDVGEWRAARAGADVLNHLAARYLQ